MKTSESLTKIIPALIAAQKEIEPALKNSQNPHFKSKFADLGSVRDALLETLTKHGLALVQGGGEPLPDGRISIETRLFHESGEWISQTLSARPVKDDPQGVGSCITYLRRYGAQAITFLTADDDDGEAASRRENQKAERAAAPAGPEPSEILTMSEMIETVSVIKHPEGKPDTYVIVAGDRYVTNRKDLAEKAKDLGKQNKLAIITYVNTAKGPEILNIKG